MRLYNNNHDDDDDDDDRDDDDVVAMALRRLTTMTLFILVSCSVYGRTAHSNRQQRRHQLTADSWCRSASSSSLYPHPPSYIGYLRCTQLIFH